MLGFAGSNWMSPLLFSRRIGVHLSTIGLAAILIVGVAGSQASAQTVNNPNQCPQGTTPVPLNNGQYFCSPNNNQQSSQSQQKYPNELSKWISEQGMPAASALAYIFTLGNAGSLGQTTGPAHVGMYTSGLNGEWQPFGDVSSTRVKALGITDTAGLAPPGTTAPTVRDLAGGGGLFGTLDVSRSFNLNANQQLIIGGVFDYQNDGITNGPVPGFASAGSLRRDGYTVAGMFLYSMDRAYLQGVLAGELGNSSSVNNTTGGAGSFTSEGISTDFRIGNAFSLFRTAAPDVPSYPVKAMPVKAPVAGNEVFLDLSAHLASEYHRDNAFTDSTGFITGNQTLQYWQAGAKAKLFENIPYNGLIWTPWVAGTIDQQFGFTDSILIPVQAAVPTGDTFFVSQAHTYWGAQAGFDVVNAAGWKFGIKGFYTASSDTTILSGDIFLKIPF